MLADFTSLPPPPILFHTQPKLLSALSDLFPARAPYRYGKAGREYFLPQQACIVSFWYSCSEEFKYFVQLVLIHNRIGAIVKGILRPTRICSHPSKGDVYVVSSSTQFKSFLQQESLRSKQYGKA